MTRFEIYQDGQDKYRFKLIIGDDTLLFSATYESKKGCKNGIELVKMIAKNAEIIDTTQ